MDAIAKEVFNADAHPERLNFLMRGIALDDTIDVRSSAANKDFGKNIHPMNFVTDIPRWLKDDTLGDLEVHKVAQEFILTRTETDCENDNEGLVIVLMVQSPDVFKENEKTCKKYIHRFFRKVSDTGLDYPAKRKMIFVQLGKCLEQYRKGENAEAEDNKPDRLQLLLAMIADVNDPNVARHEGARLAETGIA